MILHTEPKGSLVKIQFDMFQLAEVPHSKEIVTVFLAKQISVRISVHQRFKSDRSAFISRICAAEQSCHCRVAL